MFGKDIDGSIGKKSLNEVTARNVSRGEVADGSMGELCVCGPNVMRGYLNRPQQTARCPAPRLAAYR